MKTFLLPAALAALFLLPAATRADDDGDDVAADEPAVAAAGSFSFGKPKAADPANLVTVQAKGQGETVEAAKKDAVRNAIKTAVGELVDAKTLVENDELVSDKILTLSNAMVEKADYGDAVSVGDGLFEVPVKAVVKKGRLNKELEKIGIATGAVSGSSLAASLFSGKERVANAEKFFAERLKDFPGNVVEAVMLTNGKGEPDIEIDTDKGHVFANVGLRVNMANYSEWTKQLQEVLGAVCLEQEQTTLKFGERSDNRGCVESDPLKFRPPQKPAVPVLVATPAAEKVRRSTWPASLYWLDAQIWNAFLKTLLEQYPISGTIEIVLTDEDDEPVCSKVVGIAAYPRHIRRDLGCFQTQEAFVPFGCSHINGGPNSFAFVAPAFKLAIYGWQFHRSKDLTARFRIDLGEVSEDDLDAVRGFKVKVEYTKPKTNKN